MPRDPVCSVILDEKTSKCKIKHDGETYYFCSVKCTFLTIYTRVYGLFETDKVHLQKWRLGDHYAKEERGKAEGRANKHKVKTRETHPLPLRAQHFL